MVRELRETRNSLMKSVDLLSKQLSDSSNEKAALLQKIDDLVSMISVNNKVRFGSTSQKGTKKKAAPVQDREKDKDGQTSKILQKIRLRLDKLLADSSGMRGDLMNKALNYLKSFWNQLILYVKDGRCSIERSAKPLCLQRICYR